MDYRRSRYTALAALVVVFAAVVILIIADAGGGASGAATTAPRSQSVLQRRRPYLYYVHAGDSVSVIAERYGLSVAQIGRLNPGLDSNALQIGQRIKLAP